MSSHLFYKALFFNIGLVCCLALITHPIKGQEVGVSASFFLPKNGYFSTPISPLAIRGLGFEVIDQFSIESGITLYRMSGLNITDLPFESDKPLIGPTFTLLVPLEAVFELGNNRQVIRFKGGGFAFFSFDQKINAGNFDRALVQFSGYDIVNSNLSVANNLGLGFHFGGEYIYYLTDQLGISLGGYYYIGGAKSGLEGVYKAGSEQLGFDSFDFNHPDAMIDFTGFEISVGLLFGS